MAYTTAITTTKNNVESLIAALTGAETIDELLIIDKAATGLNCSNYGVLETAIETLINTQTPSTAHDDILLAARLINGTQVRTHRYYDTHHVTTSNANYPVPANAIASLVSAMSGGGGNGSAINGGGGGGGSAVVDFEIGVSGGGTLAVFVGSGSSSGNGASHTIGALTIGGGQFGSNGRAGEGGVVTLSGVIQLASDTVLLGGAGGLYGFAGENSSNGMLGGAVGGNNSAGGGASPSVNGSTANVYGYPVAGQNYGGGCSGRSVSVGSVDGGLPYPTITLKFLIEEVV